MHSFVSNFTFVGAMCCPCGVKNPFLDHLVKTIPAWLCVLLNSKSCIEELCLELHVKSVVSSIVMVQSFSFRRFHAVRPVCDNVHSATTLCLRDSVVLRTMVYHLAHVANDRRIFAEVKKTIITGRLF